MDLLNDWGLTVVVMLPIAGALLLSAIPRSQEELIKRLGLAVTVVTFVISLALLFTFDFGAASYQFETNVPWISAIGANYHIGIDGISLWLTKPRKLNTSDWRIEPRSSSGNRLSTRSMVWAALEA